MEKLVFKNFGETSRMDSFLKLNEDELQKVIKAAIGSKYCSTNEILKSLHRWVSVTSTGDAQSNDKRIETFLTLVKKMPTDEFDEKVFAKIFLDDQRLRDNAMCRIYRDEYLGDLFKVAKRKDMKRKAENIGAMPLTTGRIVETSTASCSAQQSTDSSVTVKRAAVTGHDSNEQTMEPPRRRSKKIISGGDGSDWIGYFTSKDNGSWLIGSFNLTTGDVEKITDFPAYRKCGVLFHAYNYLYFIGGRISQTASSDGQDVEDQASKRIDVFDMTKRKWMTENLPQLKEARKYFELCVVRKNEDGGSGFIHVFGGCRTDGSNVQNISDFIPLYESGQRKAKETLSQQETMETLPQTEQALDISSLKEGPCEIAPNRKILFVRTGCSRVFFGSKLYKFGASASLYDRDTKVFTKLANMHRKRSGFAALQHNNFIYIVGGDGDDHRKCGLTIEKFNTTTNEFELIENWLDKVPSDVVFCEMAWHIE